MAQSEDSVPSLKTSGKRESDQPILPCTMRANKQLHFWPHIKMHLKQLTPGSPTSNHDGKKVSNLGSFFFLLKHINCDILASFLENKKFLQPCHQHICQSWHAKGQKLLTSWHHVLLHFLPNYIANVDLGEALNFGSDGVTWMIRQWSKNRGLLNVLLDVLSYWSSC